MYICVCIVAQYNIVTSTLDLSITIFDCFDMRDGSLLVSAQSL